MPTGRAWASIDSILGSGMSEALQALRANYNTAPTQTIPIIAEDTSDTPSIMGARWGLIPPWWKEIRPPTNTINARSEEAATKPMWRQSWRTMRCLIPATHYYEWRQMQTGGKLPHALTRNDGEGFMFAGLWSVWKDFAGVEVVTCAILTRAAPAHLADIHDRMPVILAPQVWRHWLDRGVTAPEAVADILSANAMIDVNAYPIGSRVNSPRHNDAGLIDPTPDQFG